MLAANAGEISRHLRGSRLAHSVQDDADAVLCLGGTLRGQLRTTLDAAKAYADEPLGHAVPADFLYGRFAAEAFNKGPVTEGDPRSD